MSKADDGGQQWFDATMRQRMQQRAQGGNNKQPSNGKSYLDQKVNQPQQTSEIVDPYIKKLVEARQNQTFYGPAHLGGQAVDRSVAANYEVEIDMGAMEQAIMRKQSEFQRAAGGNPNSVSDMDMAKLFGPGGNPQQQATPAYLPGMTPAPESQHVPQQGSRMVTLMEGYPVFRSIHKAPTGQNTPPVTLAREIGNVNTQLASQQFLLKSSVKVCVIPQHQTQVNIQEIINNPGSMITLVEVQAPPMSSIGSLLVAQEAIVGMATTAGGRQLITDSRQYQHQIPQLSQQQPQQPSKQYGVPFNRRGLLKG